METEYREAVGMDVSVVTKFLDPQGTGRSLTREERCVFAAPHTFCPGADIFSGSLALRGKLWSNKGRIGGGIFGSDAEGKRRFEASPHASARAARLRI
jgi:hypothetical protein